MFVAKDFAIFTTQKKTKLRGWEGQVYAIITVIIKRCMQKDAKEI